MNINHAQDEMQFEQLITDLIENQYGFIDDFINTETVSGLRQNLEQFYESGQMQDAGLGNKKSHQKNKQFRGDQIKWIDVNSIFLHEPDFLSKVDRFITYLNKTCFTSINEFECHYACYARESFYKRHLDQFQNDSKRKFSIILYLNENWQIEDGGMLSLYLRGKEEINISPFGGRLVFFRSDELEHEVHPSLTRERKSIAGWLKG